MKCLLTLVLIGSALPHPGPNSFGQGQNVNTVGGVSENLLNRLSREAAWSYGQIIQATFCFQNTSQSLDNLKTALTNWAKQYGIQNEYQKFVADMEKENADFKKDVKDLMPKLTTYFTNYVKIMDDKKQSDCKRVHQNNRSRQTARR
ncbi:hypothetical protein COOONC_27391 [Cooperia oncophora]